MAEPEAHQTQATVLSIILGVGNQFVSFIASMVASDSPACAQNRKQQWQRRSAFRPILPAEGNKGDLKNVARDVGVEHDGQAMTLAAMADQPSVQRASYTHARYRGCSDVVKEIAAFVKPTCGDIEVALREFDDMVHDPDQVALDQRVLALPPQDFVLFS